MSAKNGFLRSLGESAVPLSPGVLLTVGAWMAGKIGSWAWLSGSDYIPDFSDLRQITATADCIGSMEDWSLSSPTCDPNGRAYNYPTVWARLFALVGIGQSQTLILGALLVVLMAVTVTILGFVTLRGTLSAGRVTIWIFLRRYRHRSGWRWIAATPISLC